jgi:uncharacterized repeat protein (TIGR03803 family)
MNMTKTIGMALAVCLALDCKSQGQSLPAGNKAVVVDSTGLIVSPSNFKERNGLSAGSGSEPDGRKGLGIGGSATVGAAISATVSDLTLALEANYSTPIPLAAGSDGSIYGCVPWYAGSDNLSYGLVFKASTSGAVTQLHRFAWADDDTLGDEPMALVLDADGNLLVVCDSGGANNDGTLVKVDVSTGTTTLLHAFADTDGTQPWNIIRASDGNFYGACSYGGAGQGTVWKWTVAGSFSTLAGFPSTASTGQPSTKLIELSGTLYGGTRYGNGGPSANGGFYGVTMATGALASIHDFSSTEANGGISAWALCDGEFYCLAKGDRSSGNPSGESAFYFRLAPSGGCTKFPRLPDGVVGVADDLRVCNGALLGISHGCYAPATNDQGALFILTTDGGFAPVALYSSAAAGSLNGTPVGLCPSADGGAAVAVTTGAFGAGAVSKVAFGIKPLRALRKLSSTASGLAFADSADGTLSVSGTVPAVIGSAPGTSDAEGTPWQVATDGANLYLCVGPNAWLRFSGQTSW